MKFRFFLVIKEVNRDASALATLSLFNSCDMPFNLQVVLYLLGTSDFIIKRMLRGNPSEFRGMRHQ